MRKSSRALAAAVVELASNVAPGIPHPTLSQIHSFALTWRYASFSPKGRERERKSFSPWEKARMRVQGKDGLQQNQMTIATRV
jgi:hypothetical protein